MAIRAVHQAFHHSGSLTIVASPFARQSAEFVRKAAGFLVSLGITPRGDGDNPISLLLRNGCGIVGLPGREATIRGFSNVALLLVDEASRVPDEIYAAIRPMVAANPKAAIWFLSTPNGRQGFFYEEWQQGGPEWTRVQSPIRPFEQEYMCKFVAADFAYFDPESIDDTFRQCPDEDDEDEEAVPL